MWSFKKDDGTVTEIKNNRLRELISLLDEVDGKVIIWANYIHDIEHIVKEIKKQYVDDSIVQYYGAVSSEDRADAIVKFQDKTLKLDSL